VNQQEIEAVIQVLVQHGLADIDPTEDQLRALLAGDMEGPYHFVNLLRFRDTAAYPTDHELAIEQLTGAEAYDRYGAVALAQVTRRGGRLMTLNNVERPLIGSGGPWHRIATMEYQNVNAFIDMLMDPEYQASLVHRNAGLEATEVLVTRPLIIDPVG